MSFQDGKEKIAGPHILTLICGCEGGGWHPALKLSQALRQDFSSIRVVCDEGVGAGVLNSNLQMHLLPEDTSAGYYYLSRIAELLENSGSIDENSSNPLVSWAENAAGVLLGNPEFIPPDIILSSFLAQPLAALLAGRLNIPWIYVNPSFSYMPHSFCDWDQDFSPLGAQMYRHWLYPFTRSADCVVHATDPRFDNVQLPLSENEMYCGPMFYECKGPEQADSSRNSTCVLASISSSPQPRDLSLLTTVVKASRHIEYPLILTARNTAQLTQRISTSIEVVDYFPHSRLLKNCRYLICHGGHGTVIKALSAGVPLIIVPWGRDQPGVARRAKRLGAAIVIAKENCDVQSVESAIYKMETDSSFRDNARRFAKQMKTVGGHGSSSHDIVSLIRSLIGL